MIKYKKPISIARGGRSLSFSNPETGEVTTVDVKEDYRLVNPTELKAYAPAIALGALGNTAVGSTGVTSPYLAASLPAFAMSLPVALTVGSLGLGLYNEFTGNGRPTNTGDLTRRFNDYTQAADATRVSSPYYRGRLLTESSDGLTTDGLTKEIDAEYTVMSNPPQEDPNKKKEEKKEEKKGDNKDKKDEERRTHFKTFTQKIKNGKNNTDLFWGNRLNWWETSKNSTATPLVRGMYNIARPFVAYELVREGVPAIGNVVTEFAGYDAPFTGPLWGKPLVYPTDSISSQSNNTNDLTNGTQQVYTTNIDTTAINNLVSSSDSLQNIINKRNGY